MSRLDFITNKVPRIIKSNEGTIKKEDKKEEISFKMYDDNSNHREIGLLYGMKVVVSDSVPRNSFYVVNDRLLVDSVFGARLHSMTSQELSTIYQNSIQGRAI